MIPGYRPIHKFILLTFGVDITLLVTFFASLWALFKVGKYVFNAISSFISASYMSSIQVNSDDDIYNHVIAWLANQPQLQSSRSLMAETSRMSSWEADDEYLKAKLPVKGRGEPNKSVYLNFSNQESKAPPRFTPALGAHNFWHKGTYYRITRGKSTILEQSSKPAFSDRYDLTISCYGRCPQPIKDLLQITKDYYLLNNGAKTVIRRPSPRHESRRYERHIWMQVARRPSRPMDTVVLDAERKTAVLDDVNEYLDPATAQWYANRGIPYRRGYLFHGPPGTGKTSLVRQSSSFYNVL